VRPNGLLATAIRNTGESETAAVKEMTREKGTHLVDRESCEATRQCLRHGEFLSW